MTSLLRFRERLVIIVLVVVDQETIELIDSLLCVDLLIMINFGRGRKPLPGLGILSHIEQCVGVGVPQPSQRRRRHCPHSYCGNRTLQNPSRLLILAKVPPRTCLDDDHLDAQRRVQPDPVRLARQLESIVRTAQSSLAISHHWYVILHPGHPPQGSELAQCDVVPTSGVRGLCCSLTDDRQPGSSPSRSLGVGVCQLRIVVDQLSGHDQVGCHDFRKLLGQTTQLCSHRPVQSTRVNTLRNRWFIFSTRQAGSLAKGLTASTGGLAGLPFTATLRRRLAL